ncbi:MAG TPA: hypothetical protein VFR15_13155, partial [Chloroflexia bacterium]|nr:hypothetical protein [Chloroflexia bacterium]
MIRSTLRRAAAAVAALVFALLALPTLAAAQTPPEVLEAQAIKGAAKVQYTSANPGTDPVRIVISRVVREYGLVDVYLEHEGTPTSVVVKRESGTWSGIAGPATAFPAGQRGGAPDDLFDYANPYAWQNAEPTIVSYADQYPRYEAQFAAFGYPGDAAVQPVDNSNLKIVGPESAAPNFPGPVYDIAVRATGEKILGPMDEWGYAKMLQTIAAREAQSGPGGPG